MVERKLNSCSLGSMFGVRTRMRRHVHRRLREIVAETPLVFGGDGTPDGARDRLNIDADVSLLDAILNVNGGSITIERYVFFGHGVALLTGTHDPALQGVHRMLEVPRHGRDIVIRTGAWLASNVTVIGPCEIGAHAVVAAGALVRQNVAPGQIVGGVPAKHLGWAPGFDEHEN
jgi:acetyltransferase-like isoleucine patch superfamily enzyme